MKNLNKEQQEALRREKIVNFNPNENGLVAHCIFGLPFEADESQIVLLPVPWEVTVSYQQGTAKGPEAILNASQQLDLYDPIFPGGWKAGIAMLPVDKEWQQKNMHWRAQTELYLQEYGADGPMSIQGNKILESANAACAEVNRWVKAQTAGLIDNGKMVGIVGGEHSVPLGYMQALAERHEEYGILQVDAHADLRPAYEGFTNSHASIMYNAVQIPQVTKLVQVGIRDYSEGENELVQHSQGRIVMYSDYEIKKSLMEGMGWREMAENIIAHLPEKVYISFDIDGLQPWLCPNTGTPVPGGFTIDEVFYLFEKLLESGRRIIGFDLVEVAPGETEWDGNVGARVLYKLCMLAAKSAELAI